MSKELDKEFIVKNSKPPYMCGVYFLIKDGDIVYVGQSVNVYARIRQHKLFDFDKVFIIPCDLDNLFEIEKYYIDKFSPPLNKKPGCGKMVFSMDGFYKIDNFYAPKKTWEEFRQASANVGRLDIDVLNMLIEQFVEKHYPEKDGEK